MTLILFTGYAPVHFVCFRPLFDQLCLDPDIEVLVSGGLRSTDDLGQPHQDAAAMYASFDVPAGTVVDAEDVADLDVDVLVSASTKPMKPRSYEQRRSDLSRTVFS